MIRIGIDVGGTNTDAALLDGDRVVAGVKQPTTGDVTSGVVNALRALLDRSGVAPDAIDAVMIGTTHFTNAVVERQGLAPTAAVRLGLPSTASLPPMVDWPDDLRAAIGGRAFLAHGGREFDGRPISPLDPEELRRIAGEIAAEGLRSVAVSAVFSPVSADDERQAAEILSEALPGIPLTLSSEIGQLGLLERENAAIMNACLREMSGRVVEAFRAAVAETGIGGRVFLTRNDGTLMDADLAARFPVLTFASGPTNSMRGAAFLSGLRDAIVLDIGGTTSDLGMIVGGFPRQAPLAVEVGGVRTNFRMPEVFSVGLGGGSILREGPDGPVAGPRTVGYRLTAEARVFGGDTLTATDIAVAAGIAQLGDPARVADLPPALVDGALAHVRATLARGIDRARLSPAPLPVIVVGGGSILAAGMEGPDGAAIVIPPHHAVANAVGAAIATVSGEVDTVVSLAGADRDAALHAARRQAVEAALAAGAAPASVEIVDVEDVPLTYLPGNATRIRVRAIGVLDAAG